MDESPSEEPPILAAEASQPVVIKAVAVNPDPPAVIPPRTNPFALSLGSLFTITTLVALAVTIFCYYPPVLCLLTPLSLPATARTIFIRDLRVKLGQVPTLTDMSLDFGTSLGVSAVAVGSAILCLLQLSLPLTLIGGASFVPLALVISLSGMVVVGIYPIAEIWNVFAEHGGLPTWKQRGQSFIFGSLKLAWLHLGFLYVNCLLSPYQLESEGNLRERFLPFGLCVILLSGAGIAGYAFAKYLPLTAAVTAVALGLGTIVGWPVVVTIAGLCIGLGFEAWNLRQQRPARAIP
jgi:hypothetical protein